MKNIGFIGCGKMASAIIKGVINSKFINPENIIASKSSSENIENISKTLGIELTLDNNYLVQKSDVICIAVKPNQVNEVLENIKDDINSEKLIISVAAGVKTEKIENILNKNIKVIRVMPNTPVLVNEGMAGICKGKYANDEDLLFVKSMFDTIGKSVIVEENQIDIVTAISGSGPAFFYKIINEIAHAGEKLGLDYDKALLLSIQTAIGSAKMALNRNLPMEDLISNVATKGGCTAVGVDCMNKNNTENVFYEVIKSTTEKAKALGN